MAPKLNSRLASLETIAAIIGIFVVLAPAAIATIVVTYPLKKLPQGWIEEHTRETVQWWICALLTPIWTLALILGTYAVVSAARR